MTDRQKRARIDNDTAEEDLATGGNDDEDMVGAAPILMHDEDEEAQGKEQASEEKRSDKATPSDKDAATEEEPTQVALPAALPTTQYAIDEDPRLDAADEDFRQIPSEHVQENTPSKSVRNGITKPIVGVWKYIKRLRNLHAALIGAGYSSDFADKEVARKKGKLTHVCIKCWRLLHMGYDKAAGRWTTTAAVSHARKFHDTVEGRRALRSSTRSFACTSSCASTAPRTHRAPSPS